METKQSKTIEVCLTPDLFQYRQSRGDLVIVVVDIFRAGSSICAALDNGFSKIKPVSDLSEAKKLKSEYGWLAAGERNGIRLDFADFGNSPVSLAKAKGSDFPLILTTSNGTRAIDIAKGSGEIVIGAFNNLGILTQWLLSKNQNIAILCSGWMGSMSMEDSVFAGALIAALIKDDQFYPINDEALAALQLWNNSKANLVDSLQTAMHFKRLVALGAKKDIDFALTLDNTNVIPQFDGEFISNFIQK